ncbi:MAG: hypothetical protein ABWW69_02985 [Pyrodictiaceae archaeon]
MDSLTHRQAYYYSTFYSQRKNNEETVTSRIDEARLRCIAKCIFSLSEEEAQILAYLIKKNKRAIVKDIAEELRRNPEVVRRALRGLYMKSLVTRRPYPLRRGGRAYIYEVPSHVIEVVTKVCRYVNEVVTANMIKEQAPIPQTLGGDT